MKWIQPSGKHGVGKLIIVDDEDYERLQGYRWHISMRKDGRFYAARGKLSNGKIGLIYMHREILGLQPGDSWQVDHVHHYSTVIVNQKHNLRLCTGSQNQGNRRTAVGSSVYKGVYWDWKNGRKKLWKAQILHSHPKRQVYLGNFLTEIDAAKAYDVAAREYFGPFARTNLP